MVCLLVWCCESSEYYHVVQWYLEKPASFQAYPVCVFLYFKIQCFPVISFLKVKFFYKIGPLTSIEPCYYIQRLIFECKSGMEVSSGIQVSFLCPSVSCNVINFTLIHAFLRQRRTNRKYLWFLFLNKHTCQRVSSSFKKHVSSLN